MLDLIPEILRRADAGEPLAVCIVARTRGSAPQKAGATMLVLQNGQTLGTLGGGCVEAEVRVRALELIQSREHRLLTFRLDNDYGWDDGLVCGGAMDIAVRIVATPEDAIPWRAASEELAAGKSATVIVEVIDESGKSASFNQAVLPAPTLVIAGAGHVGAALASIARQMDFNVTVIDDRADFATSQRFPTANCVVGEIETELSKLSITEHTYVVVVTRGHRRDAQALAAVIGSPAKYVGLIGSKRKVVTILESLCAQGIAREQLARVHAPIGLRINAMTPAEIAISIAAEMVAVRRGVTPGPIESMRLNETQLARLFEKA